MSWRYLVGIFGGNVLMPTTTKGKILFLYNRWNEDTMGPMRVPEGSLKETIDWWYDLLGGTGDFHEDQRKFWGHLL
jgi:hypothetical protein